MEDRRVLYNPGELEVPSQWVESVVRIREFLTNELSSADVDHEIDESLRAMRGACRKFLDTVSKNDGEIVRLSMSHGHWASWRFYPALGEMRGVFGVHIALLSVRFGIDIEDDLASITPIGEGRSITDDSIDDHQRLL